jgi:endoglucanase
VDYILGDNSLRMSYMVGHGVRFPHRIHHRVSSPPSVVAHPTRIRCKIDAAYYANPKSNLNLLVGVIVDGPNDVSDAFPDMSAALRLQATATTLGNADDSKV